VLFPRSLALRAAGVGLAMVSLGASAAPEARAAVRPTATASVNTLNGNLVWWTYELALLQPTWPVKLQLVYNSRDTKMGLSGRGWSSSLDWSLVDRHNGQLALTRVRYASHGALTGWQSEGLVDPTSLEGAQALDLQRATDVLNGPSSADAQVYRLLHPAFDPPPAADPAD
jgi:Domain of unknown function (DUF6531)